MNSQNKILVVDDDEAKRYSICRVLKAEGFEVIEAADGASGLQRAQERPVMIVLDVKLPDMSGFEVCRRLKSDAATSSIPIVHMSATLVETGDRVQGLDSGADAYLTDIVNPLEFIATIRALLRAREAERALRESEVRFQSLVRNVQEYAIFTSNPRGTITSWNEGVQRILGYRRDDFTDQPYSIVFATEEEAKSDLQSAAEQGAFSYERWHERNDGSRFFASGSVTAIYDEEKNLLGFTTIVRDVTERKETEEERSRLLAAEQSARRDAETANRLKDEFLATLSHELRTPLTAILGWTQLFKISELSPSEVQTGMDVIDRNAKAQAQLIEDLLDVSRIISGKLRLNVEIVEMASVLDAAVEAVRSAADGKRIQIIRIVDPGAGPIMGDSGRLQQIIWNLLSNAIKFTPKSGKVTLRLRRVESQVEISVQDDGQGIAPEFLPYVFDRFRQADASTMRMQGGLGLGLAIVRHLTELHGGSVHADSRGIGLGSTFTVRLPIVAVTHDVEPRDVVANETSRFEHAALERMPDLTGLKILVVDDERDSREILSRILRRCGADTEIAPSAQGGVEAFNASRPDIIISDICMPGEDGYMFIRRVRAAEGPNKANVPAVALTAFARADDRRKALLAGYQVHLAKPVIPSELIAVVASLSGRTNRN
ncbi:MAG: response regulator [Planctomycetia bacterium]|nr:response regulator [Planctomycetia bacterium]